jgi:thymidylate kinase
MALITKNKITRIEKGKNSVHMKVECTFTSFTDKDGRKFVQLDTYGSDLRKIKDKISQSIQFDQESAKVLIDILKKEFKL